MKAEFDALNQDATWVINNLPTCKNPIGRKWRMYKIKYKVNGTIGW